VRLARPIAAGLAVLGAAAATSAARVGGRALSARTERRLNDAASIGRAIVHAVGVIGADHVALGSDFDGAVPVPFDVTGLVLLTEALIAEGLADEDIMEIMGGNAVRLLMRCLPRG
jgi:microsomal dipeptidase-like Zn-dependent dipeptidase